VRTFLTTDSTLVARNGEPIEVLRAIRHEDNAHDYECLPMFLVRFPDGSTIEAWRDEIRPWYARGFTRTANIESVPDVAL
jgi:hypothetical protein